MVGLLKVRSESTNANCPLARAAAFSCSIASWTTRWPAAEETTNCTGKPPTDPGRGAGRKAEAAMPSMPGKVACRSAMTMSALRCRLSHGLSITPAQPLFRAPPTPDTM
ncbi:hypothetical protein D3C85_1166990 [compost metagenome]